MSATFLSAARPVAVRWSTLALSVALTGCALNTPPPVDMGHDTRPLTTQKIAEARQQQAMQQAATGSLFNAGNYRPAFENRRARAVGDIVTINITERSSGAQRQNTNINRENSLMSSASALPFLKPGASILGKLSANLNTESEFSGSGNTSSNNNFSGSITATVVDVLPNGHLVVSGEKQIGLNHNVDTLRFTGTVDPYIMQPGSVVDSTQVANVRVESRSRGPQGAAQAIGWLSSFFLNFLPF